MVSLRRRRLLGLCSGKDSFPVELPETTEIGNTVDKTKQNFKSLSVHPIPSVDSSYEKLVDISEAFPESMNISFSSSPKENPDHYFPEKQIKRRKQHRRKHYNDQEPCIMRGVYFKNMKWQAAIKVEKKQIHLGTVGSQVEAAKLYDSAAFIIGRETNFELSEEEKRELRQYTWEEYLAKTRNNIASKKQCRRFGTKGKKPGSEREQRAASSMSFSDDQDANASSL